MAARHALLWTAAVPLVMALSACGDSKRAQPAPPEANKPLPRAQAAEGENDVYAGTTPMAERVAVIGLLNKRNGLVRDVTLKPGESIRIGRALIRLRACERTAQWEWPQETGAFVQLIVLDHSTNKWQRAFSGWLFKDRPERNVVQHPIYDVFVRSCTMTWPGEREMPTAGSAASSNTAAPNRRSNANQSPAAAAATTAEAASSPAAAASSSAAPAAAATTARD